MSGVDKLKMYCSLTMTEQKFIALVHTCTQSCSVQKRCSFVRGFGRLPHTFSNDSFAKLCAMRVSIYYFVWNDYIAAQFFLGLYNILCVDITCNTQMMYADDKLGRYS